VPLSAVDAISPAFEHTKRQLLHPFRVGQWIRLALVGLLAGELSSGGGCNVPNTSSFHIPRHPGTEHFLAPGFAGIDPALYVGLIAVVLLSAFVLVIVFMYIGSVMRFILFDSVLAKECHIREKVSDVADTRVPREKRGAFNVFLHGRRRCARAGDQRHATD